MDEAVFVNAAVTSRLLVNGDQSVREDLTSGQTSGYAHIAYSHDAPTLGGPGSYTGYAPQTSGTTIGAPN